MYLGQLIIVSDVPGTSVAEPKPEPKPEPPELYHFTIVRTGTGTVILL
jgi:hypothetical protein